MNKELLDSIVCCDCVDGMMCLDDESIDLTITSPPYDNLRKYNGFSFDFGEVARHLYRVTKRGGVVVWIVSDAVKNGSETGTSFRQALGFMDAGFNLNDTMIWKKTNPMPRVKTSRYFDCFEYMFVFSKGKPKTFNPIMVPCKSAGAAYKSTCKNMGGENGRTYKEFEINRERYRDNVWNVAIAQNKTKHPAVFPEAIARDHIISWSNEGDVILDPFIGSGTTAKAANDNGRHFIGFDCSEAYCSMARDRICG